MIVMDFLVERKRKKPRALEQAQSKPPACVTENRTTSSSQANASRTLSLKKNVINIYETFIQFLIK